MRDDTASTPTPEQVEAVLRQRLCGRVRELRVVVRAEGVVLHGASANYYGKQLAQHLAHQLFRLPIAANKIEVRSIAAPATDALPDVR
jgi:hypothetical protein